MADELVRRMEGVYSSIIYDVRRDVSGSSVAYFRVDDWAEGAIRGTATLIFVNEFAEAQFRSEYARRLRLRGPA